MKLAMQYMNSPVGRLRLIANEKALVAVLWENEQPKRIQLAELVVEPEHPVLLQVRQQLEEYFEGNRQRFDIPLDFAGTEFQKLVWTELLKIPYGQTRSYGQIAQAIGRPKAMRAVGAANGRNPISIIAPCHRVIGASGALTGFAGGLDNKTILLNLEKNIQL
ncbi:glycosyltransferase [Acinetobacter radioresistens]|uniref:methylated-DNA--[protein]-cysteine S-methyltransferase n=1 Tax=Acinetobacter radioresistens TaxID=40216 RepID=UPI000D0AF621|nr:methylated-DNA--[protein]-cysteine S-methyltransferase [Acinetobacter radioresistens]AWV87266.1 methylated-DNA--[protein]-cysteine S-methyltransferase [Acinetobacter radioresistens]MCK4091190.1 methylated-DNA--[protein]-cysteine S-methyltransferase [Acinetobacter radioresistens]MCU4596429.1 methylated-DNA--[protein]-cysteine S-methyltransferase [Acinetobacter radioresistens]MCX0329030.1 methylated-DNA--[protein]-cysteine S-methyltransferase [Acinetobacter radioresistens]PSD34529.1 glycosylt